MKYVRNTKIFIDFTFKSYIIHTMYLLYKIKKWATLIAGALFVVCVCNIRDIIPANRTQSISVVF